MKNNNEVWIKKIVKLYFQGYSVDEALKTTKTERDKEKLKILKKIGSDNVGHMQTPSKFEGIR